MLPEGRTAAEMLLKILMAGETVQHEGRTWGLSEDNRMVTAYGDKWMAVDCDIQAFCAMADLIGKDELWLKLCAMQLPKLRKGT